MTYNVFGGTLNPTLLLLGVMLQKSCHYIQKHRVCDTVCRCSSPSDQAQSPEDIPPIDPRIVYDLELQAQRVAGNLDNVMQTLSNKLYKVKLLF